ncbi:hypothetical protein [Endozoicomonas sp. ISHI1]|uniref:hypothetical protein n=1 Tax=Endozoicomonas sp. ISHI1 TaxID=2825882 RepID=UPI0021479B2A|nr:hypothetical protein [Endozoicomonas sp. ISHI1]
MSDTLFNQLKNIGISEELAAKVSASLDPDYNASKKDVLIMQEAIFQHQALFNQKMADMNAKFDAEFKQQKAESDARYEKQKAESDARYEKQKAESDARKAESDARYHEVKAESDARYHEVKMDSMRAYAELKTEIHTTINRQYLVTFGSALLTIASVLAVNWYFHV